MRRIAYLPASRDTAAIYPLRAAEQSPSATGLLTEIFESFAGRAVLSNPSVFLAFCNDVEFVHPHRAAQGVN
jgi:hypothetical protein